jgi:hypothetical protein
MFVTSFAGHYLDATLTNKSPPVKSTAQHAWHMGAYINSLKVVTKKLRLQASAWTHDDLNCGPARRNSTAASVTQKTRHELPALIRRRQTRGISRGGADEAPTFLAEFCESSVKSRKVTLKSLLQSSKSTVLSVSLISIAVFITQAWTSSWLHEKQYKPNFRRLLATMLFPFCLC